MDDAPSVCAHPELNALIGEYVTGRLAADQIEMVELHLLDCADCWEEARLGAAVHKARPRASRRRPMIWLPPLAAVAAVVTVLLFPSRNPYAELGRVTDAPAFTPAGIRTPPLAATAATDSGMAAYARRDYDAAARLLARGTADQPGTAFFLGVSHLLVRRPEDALEALRRAQVPAGNAFEAEAQFYLAKAFLQLGQPDSAAAQLRALEASPTIGPQAAALRRAIAQVRRTP